MSELNKICSDCGSSFKRNHHSQKYCSKDCAAKALKKSHKKAVSKYQKSEKGKLALKRSLSKYQKTEKGKLSLKKSISKYRKTEKGKLAFKKGQSKYQKTEKGKGALGRSYNKYRKTEKGKLALNKAMKKQRQNPEKNIRFRLRSLFSQAMRMYSQTGKIMSSGKYGINYEKIIKQLEPFPEELHKYHIDHIVPLSHFNLNDPEEIKKAFAPENHQWLLALENIRKSNKLNWISKDL